MVCQRKSSWCGVAAPNRSVLSLIRGDKKSGLINENSSFRITGHLRSPSTWIFILCITAVFSSLCVTVSFCAFHSSYLALGSFSASRPVFSPWLACLLPPAMLHMMMSLLCLAPIRHTRKASIATVGWCTYTGVVGVGSWGTWPT